MTQIDAKSTQWLWKNWLPLGKLVLFAGESGTGKTNIAMSIAATISNGGNFADGSKCDLPGKVLIYSTEDSASDTIKPRIMSYGGDLSKISVVKGSYDSKGCLKPFEIEEIEYLYKYAEENTDLRLIIFDPIVSLLKKDMNQANYVRQALEPLLIFAEKYNCTILCITHLTKAKHAISLKDRIIGSQAFTAVARFVLVTSKSTASNEYYFSVIKSNISELQNVNLAYQIDTADVGENIQTSTTNWLNLVYGDIDELPATSESLSSNRRSSQIDKAKQVILDKLKEKNPVHSQIIKAWCYEYGISESTMERAVKELKINRFKRRSEWFWDLPEKDIMT